MLANAPVAAVLPCTDVGRTRQFYGQTLGLPEMPMPMSGGAVEQEQTVAAFQCGGGTMLFLYQREEPTKAEHTVAGWILDDFDATANELVQRGVAFETYPEMPGVEWDKRGVSVSPDGTKGAWFKDPDGNILAVTQSPG